MPEALSPYWVTVRLDPCRTADRRIMARSDWADWWLGCQLRGSQTVVMVRRVE
jgi:hypothetical protein